MGTTRVLFQVFVGSVWIVSYGGKWGGRGSHWLCRVLWVSEYVSRNSPRFMNENQVFALHFIQISASFCRRRVLCFLVLFCVFGLSSFTARARHSYHTTGGHLLILDYHFDHALQSRGSSFHLILLIFFLSKDWLNHRTLISPILHGLHRPSRWTWCHSMTLLASKSTQQSIWIMYTIFELSFSKALRFSFS